MLASLIIGVALWQAQVVVERESAGKHKNLPLPTDTRHAIRQNQTDQNVDPIADYITRCKKGMTIQEIRWALTDFENAGLLVRYTDDGRPSAEELAFRNKQGHWYLQCLTEGLHLSSEQASEAREAMRKLFQEEYESRVKILKEHEISKLHPKSAPMAILEEIEKNWEMPDVFERMMPWELCALTDMQNRMTWKQWYESANSNFTSATQGIDAILGSPELSDPEKLAEKTGGPLFLLGSPHAYPRYVPKWLCSVNGTFPLLACQNTDTLTTDFNDPFFEFNKTDQKNFLQQLQSLHPSQLKTALLLEPKLFSIIRGTLEDNGL